MKYFLSSQSLGNDVYLAKFWSNDKSKNHLQNHFAVVQKGREIFIRCLISICTYLDCTLVSCNCNSFWLNSAIKTKGKQPIFVLDEWLRPQLNEKQISEYMKMKFLYFIETYVCPQHVEHYKQKLLSKTPYDPPQCCKDFKSVNSPFKLKIVSTGNAAMVIKINKSITIDGILGEVSLKCSGIKGKNFDNFFKSCNNDIQQALVHLQNCN